MDFKRAVLTAGLMGAAACGPPDGTRQLTEDELDFVAEKIDKEQESLDAAASLLGGTNTFFGLEGKKIKNNEALLDTLDGQMKNVRERLGDGGILVGNEEFFEKVADENNVNAESISGEAHGCRSKWTKIGDYTVIPETQKWTTSLENGDEVTVGVNPPVGTFAHEEIHYTYGPHQETPDLRTNRTTIKYLMRDKDAPYLGSELSEVGAAILSNEMEAISPWSEDFYENMQTDIKNGAQTPQDVYDYFLYQLPKVPDAVESDLWFGYDSGQLFLLTNHGLTEEDYANYVEERRETLIEEREEAIHATMERLLKDYPGQIELGEN